jgi:hypothetical protein
VLAAAAAAVSFTAQYRMVDAARHLPAIAALEAAIPDTAALVFACLPGITDVTTLDAAAKLCGQASWKVRGQDHATRHDVATPARLHPLHPGPRPGRHGCPYAVMYRPIAGPDDDGGPATLSC